MHRFLLQYRKLSLDLRHFISVFMLALFVFSAFRFAFYLVYASEFSAVSLSEVLRGFIHGIRFDAAIIAIGFSPLLVLIAIPVLNRFRVYRGIWLGYELAVLLVFLILLVADLQYFEYSHKRLGYEAFAYLDSGLFPIVQTAIADNPLMSVVFVLLLTGFALLSWQLFKKVCLHRSRGKFSLNDYMLTVALIPVFVILARGGWQRVPLRTPDSFISRFDAVNVLVNNSPHMAWSNYGTGGAARIMDWDTAKSVCQKLLNIDPERLINPDYPIYVRNLRSQEDIYPYNVVIFLMESWTGKFAGPNSEYPEVTPFFNALCKEGVFFDRFIAGGFRTTSGVFPVLTGIPDQVGAPVMQRQEIQDHFGSISVLLKPFGYTNLFIHGGLLDFDNLGKMLVHEGFDLVLGANDLEGCGGKEHIWGYDDEFAFERAHQEFAKMGTRPFFGYVMSVSSHAPYELPDERHNVFDASFHEEYRYLNAYRYSDYVLGQFFEKARRSPYFDKTIFIITGDHTHHKNLNLYENQHLPLLIYAPSLLKPDTKSTIGSQTDILPTVAGLLNLPDQAALGRNLLALNNDEGFAYWIGGEQIGWVEGDYIAVMGLDNNPPMIYNYRNRDLSTNLLTTDSLLARDYRIKASAFYQFSNDLLKRDLIIVRRQTNSGAGH